MDVIYESANFFGPGVRRAARAVGLRTEASGRFEKGLDPQMTLDAANRCCELTELLGAGEVVAGVIDVDHSDKELRRIPFDAGWINRFLGTQIEESQMLDILESLQFGFENGCVVVPSFRADVERAADVAEEVARIYGYNNIPNTLMKGEVQQGGRTPAQKFERAVDAALLAQGFSEICTYTFISPKLYEKFLLPEAERRSVVIKNPLGEDTSIMRTSSLPSMMQTLSLNYSRRNQSASLYEIAKIFLPGDNPDELPEERRIITLGMYGAGDFLRIKGALEGLFAAVDAGRCEYRALADNPSMHPGRTAAILLGGRQIGLVGEVHPTVCKNFGMDLPCYAAAVDLALLHAQSGGHRAYRPLPKFPAATRDLALICRDDLPVAEMQRVIEQAAGDICEEVKLFDVYRGKQVPQGLKSVAWSITLRHEDRTLTDAEADAAVERILRALGDQLDCRLRG